MKMNLALERSQPQGTVVEFPKKERSIVSRKDGSYTKMPNIFIDNQIMAQLNDKSFKCLIFIIRQTSGYDRVSYPIAITQFQKYCGIKKRDTVMSCIRELEEKKIIKVTRKSGYLNVYSLLPSQPLERVFPLEERGDLEQDGTGPIKQDETSPIKQGPNKEKPKENLKENLKENINTIFEFWKSIFSKTEKVVLSDKRKTKILARLKQGYTVDEIKQAIVNCSQSDYHIKNAYTDIELICREPEKLDRFINMNNTKHIQYNLNTLDVNQDWKHRPEFTGNVECVILEEWML